MEDVKFFLRSLVRFFPILGTSFLFGLLGSHKSKISSDKVNGELWKILAEMRIKIEDFESNIKDFGYGPVSNELEIQIMKKRIFI